jgi:protein TonB
VIVLSRFRFLIAAALSAVLMASFFTVLQTLISHRPDIEEQMALSKVEFVRLRKSVEIEPKKREKVEREKPQQAPVTPTLNVAKDEGFNLELDVQAINAGLGAEFGSAGGRGGDGSGRGALAFSSGLSDRDPLPLVRVDPQYPPQAQRRGLEGWVHVHFTVTTAGSIRDVKVVKSSHSMFERAAVAAAQKWKYQPALKSGKPIEFETEAVIRFEMDKSKG